MYAVVSRVLVGDAHPELGLWAVIGGVDGGGESNDDRLVNGVAMGLINDIDCVEV